MRYKRIVTAILIITLFGAGTVAAAHVGVTWNDEPRSTVEAGETIQVEADVSADEDGTKVRLKGSGIISDPTYDETTVYSDGIVSLETDVEELDLNPGESDELYVQVEEGGILGHSAKTTTRKVTRPRNVDAEVRDFEVPTNIETHNPPNEVGAIVVVENTGNVENDFFVGYSVSDESGTSYDNDAGTGQTVSLEPGEVEHLYQSDISWTIEDDAPTGSYDAETAVWEESNPDNLQTRLDGEEITNAFKVRAPALRVTPKSEDVGNVPRDDPKTVRYEVKNEGVGDLEWEIISGNSIVEDRGDGWFEVAYARAGEFNRDVIVSALNDHLEGDSTETVEYRGYGTVDPGAPEARGISPNGGTLYVGNSIEFVASADAGSDGLPDEAGDPDELQFAWQRDGSVEGEVSGSVDSGVPDASATYEMPFEQTGTFEIETTVQDTQTGLSDSFDRVSIDVAPVKISGTVTDDEFEEPISGATVSVDGTQVATTNSDGEYTATIDELDAAASHEVTIEPPQYAENGYDPETTSTAFEGGEAVVDETLTATSKDVRFVVSDAADIEGYEPDGDTIEGATLEINGETYQTGEEGGVDLTLSAGMYDYTVTADGFETLNGELKIRDGTGLRRQSVQLVRDGAGALSIEVVDSAGNDISPVDYELEADGQNIDPNAQGQVLLDAGEYTLTAEGDGNTYGTATQEIEIVEGKTTTETLTLTEQYELNAQTTRGGKVEVNPPGATGEEITKTYDPDTAVQLIAVPDVGYEFDGWQGIDRDTNESDVTLTMDGDQSVTATFSETGEALPEDVNAEVVPGSFSVDTSEELSPGDTVQATVDVVNTGESAFTFFIGYSARGPNSQLYDNQGTTGKTVHLEPAQTKTVELEWGVPSYAPEGSYDFITAIWEDYPQDGMTPFDQSKWLSDEASINNSNREQLDAELRTVVEEYVDDEREAVGVLPSVEYRDETYRVAVYLDGDVADWNGAKASTAVNRAFTHQQNGEDGWEQLNVQRVLVFQSEGSGYQLTTNESVVYNVTATTTSGATPFYPYADDVDVFGDPEYNDYNHPSEEIVNDVDDLLTNYVFTAQRIEQSWMQTEEEKYTHAVRSMAGTGKVSILPDSTVEQLSRAEDADAAISTAETLLVEEDNERIRAVLNTYIENVERVDSAESLGKYGSGTATVLETLVYFAEYDVYADDRIRDMERVLEIADERDDVTLDPAAREAMETVIAEHDDLQEKQLNRFVEFIREKSRDKAFDIGSKTGATLTAEFGRYAAQKVGMSSVVTKASIKTAASQLGAGLVVSDYLYNMSGMYEQGINAKYSYKLTQEYDAIADTLREENQGRGLQYETIADYRAADSLQTRANAEFWKANSQILNATWVSDARDSVMGAFGITDGNTIAETRERQYDRGEQLHQTATDLYRPASLDRAVESQPETATGPPEIAVPETVVLNSTEQGSITRFTIQNTGGSVLSVPAVTVPHSRMSAAIDVETIAPGENATVELETTEPLSNDSITSAVYLNTNVAQSPTMIPVTANESDNDQSFFAVETTNTTRSIAPDDPLELTVIVENIGEQTDTKDVKLVVSDAGTNSTPVQLNAGGSREVTLAVPNPGGESDSYTATVATPDTTDTAEFTVEREPTPNATILATETTTVDTPTQLTAADSSTDTEITSYNWDINNNGEYDADGQSITHSFSESGTQSVTLRVTNSAGNTDTDTVTIQVEDGSDDPKITAEAGGPYSVTANETVALDASESTPINTKIVDTDWELLGELGTVEGNTYQAPDELADDQTVQVQLTVTAANGATDTDTADIAVDPQSTPDDPSPSPTLRELAVGGTEPPATITAGEDEPISAVLENPAETEATVTTELTLGETTASTETTVAPEATETVRFENVTADLAAGNYTVAVQTQQDTATLRGNLTVRDADTEPSQEIKHAEDVASAVTGGDGDQAAAEKLVVAAATNDSLTLGGSTGRTIEIRHPETDRQLEVIPETDSALTAEWFALDVYDADGSLSDDPTIDDLENGRTIPAQVSGDENIFTDIDGPFTTYSLALREDGDTVDTTAARQIGIDYPNSFEQNATDGTVAITLPRDDAVSEEWTAEFELEPTAEGGPLVSQEIEHTEQDDVFRVTINGSDIEQGIYDSRITLENTTGESVGFDRVIAVGSRDSITTGDPADIAPTVDITAEAAGNADSPLRIDVFVEDRVPESATLEIKDSEGETVFTKNVTKAFQKPRVVSRKVEWDPVNETGDQLPDGTYTAVFTAEDEFGNEVNASESIAIDSTPPTIDTVEIVSDDVTTTDESIVLGANITSAPSNLSTVELGVAATAADYTRTTTLNSSEIDQQFDGDRVELTVDPATLAAAIGEGNFTVTARATDTAGNTEVVTNDTLTVDTAVEGSQSRVTGLGTTQATLQVTADEAITVTDVEIVAEAADGTTANRSPTTQAVPEAAGETVDIQFDGSTIGDQDTTITATAELEDAAGNTELVTVNASITEYELSDGEAVVDPNGTDATFTLATASTADNESRSATVGQTTTPPAGTALDANQSAPTFIDVTDIGLTEEELQNATVRIPVERIDMDGVSPEELVYFYSPDGSDEYQVLEPELENGDLVVEVDGFSQLAPGRVDEQPPTVSITTAETPQANETLKITYDDELSAIDVSSVDISVNGNAVTAADGLQVTASNATYTLPDAAEYTVSVDVADEAGNTAEKTRTLQDGQTRPAVTEVSGLDGTTVANDTDTVELEYEYEADSLDTEATTLSITADGSTSPVSPVVDGGQISYELDVTEGTNYTADLTVGNEAGETRTTTEFSVAHGDQADDDANQADGGGDQTGGGGGGAGGMPSNGESSTQTELFEFEDETTVRLSDVPRSGSADIDTSSAVTGGPFDLTRVQMQFRFDVPDFRLEITDPRTEAGSAPTLPDAAGTPVGFLELDAIGANQVTVDRTTATVTVDESAVPDGESIADLTAYQYADGEWRSLATDTSGETLTTTLATHKAEHIALAVEAETDADPDASDDSNTTNETESTEDADSNETESTEPSTDQTTDDQSIEEIPGFGALTAIGAVVAVLLYSRFRYRQ